MDKAELRYELVSIVRDLQLLAHDIIAPICAKHGVTMQQMYVLMELFVEPGQKVSALSDRVGILHTNFPQVSRRLEEKELIRRSRSDSDRRSFILSLTESGEALFQSIDRDIASTLEKRLSSTMEETYQAAIGGLRALRSCASSMDLEEIRQ